MLLGLELVQHHVPLALPEPTCLLIINIMSTQEFKKHKNKLWVSQGTGVRKHSKDVNRKISDTVSHVDRF